MPNPALSEAQLAANQANAQHSTGPRTPEGRAASSRNNLRHGFRSLSVLLPGDNGHEYQELFDLLTEHFEPADLTEFRHVREMADAEWRLRRVRHQLELALTRRMAILAPDYPDADLPELQSLALETLGVDDRGPSYSTWLRYESKFERQYHRANRSWNDYQDRKRAAERRNRRDEQKALDDLAWQAAFGPTPGFLAPGVPRPQPSSPGSPDQPQPAPGRAATASASSPAAPDRQNGSNRAAIDNAVDALADPAAASPATPEMASNVQKISCEPAPASAPLRTEQFSASALFSEAA